MWPVFAGGLSPNSLAVIKPTGFCFGVPPELSIAEAFTQVVVFDVKRIPFIDVEKLMEMLWDFA
ncbi:hypothetical protein SAMN05444003_0123 [Cognatiyoonia sediminum]|uniref:Uncharacterized protein n=1 Tax=Cognatiyoonia sediminum TaxID=1508389 RepID=A0A1M5L670_9RHOB|nr:hypothetical protein [Cognatiyoonia sediminum]SHG60466.1 hypothetical protein SAMN05444003_0123 [Cognatiyoonia sediminum]